MKTQLIKPDQDSITQFEPHYIVGTKEYEHLTAVCEAADKWDKARNGRELDMAYDRLIAALDKWRERAR